MKEGWKKAWYFKGCFFPFWEKYVKTVQPLAWGYMPGRCMRYGLLKNSFSFHLWQLFQIWRNQWLSSNRLHLLGNFDLPQQLFMSIFLEVFVGPLQIPCEKKTANSNDNHACFPPNPLMMAFAKKRMGFRWQNLFQWVAWHMTAGEVLLMVSGWNPHLLDVLKDHHLLDVFCLTKSWM